jgi:hypothetical protein
VSPSGVDWGRQGPPMLFYLVVYQERRPPVKVLITVDGVVRHAEEHAEDKRRGFDWGPYDLYAVSLEGPVIVKTSVKALLEESAARFSHECGERIKAMGA